MAEDLWDACVVGAGPVGSTCAWYLARRGLRVLLLDKQRFPRDKLCGDAVTTRAQLHLERMGVLGEVLAAGEGHWAEVGGFVSPSGLDYIADSTAGGARPLVIAIKRIALDVRVARAAARAGAELVEEAPVARVAFSPAERAWMVHEAGNPGRRWRARVLVVADGALSRLARALGLVPDAPDAVCSRAYVEAGSADFSADGLVFYPRGLLPGYCALFREADGDLNFCCYVIPGGSTRLTDLRARHETIVRRDPHVSAALGSRARLAAMRAAPLRLGGVGRSYADHLVVVGDAAGHIDPLTGEGIQYGLDAAEMAAETIAEAFAAGDWSAAVLRRYQDRWMDAFGRDFRWSRAMSLAYARYPIFLDAWAAIVRRRGRDFFMDWAAAMTGTRPKRSFLRPGLLLPITREALRQWWLGPPAATRAAGGVGG